MTTTDLHLGSRGSLHPVDGLLIDSQCSRRPRMVSTKLPRKFTILAQYKPTHLPVVFPPLFLCIMRYMRQLKHSGANGRGGGWAAQV